MGPHRSRGSRLGLVVGAGTQLPGGGLALQAPLLVSAGCGSPLRGVGVSPGPASARPARLTFLADPSARRAVYTQLRTSLGAAPLGARGIDESRFGSRRRGLGARGHRLPWEGARRGPPRAAFVWGLARRRSDLTRATRGRRVGSAPPAPAHLGEGCHCAAAAGGTGRRNFSHQRVLRPRVSVAVIQVRRELPKRQQGKGPLEAEGAQVLSPRWHA